MTTDIQAGHREPDEAKNVPHAATKGRVYFSPIEAGGPSFSVIDADFVDRREPGQPEYMEIIASVRTNPGNPIVETYWIRMLRDTPIAWHALVPEGEGFPSLSYSRSTTMNPPIRRKAVGRIAPGMSSLIDSKIEVTTWTGDPGGQAVSGTAQGKNPFFNNPAE